MQMAIDKAKKHGVGFVACRNSTVSSESIHSLPIFLSSLSCISCTIQYLIGICFCCLIFVPLTLAHYGCPCVLVSY